MYIPDLLTYLVFYLETTRGSSIVTPLPPMMTMTTMMTMATMTTTTMTMMMTTTMTTTTMTTTTMTTTTTTTMTAMATTTTMTTTHFKFYYSRRKMCKSRDEIIKYCFSNYITQLSSRLISMPGISFSHVNQFLHRFVT
jgi:hypothetical protein